MIFDLGRFSPRRGGKWRARYDVAEEVEDERQAALDAKIAADIAERRAWLHRWGQANLEPRPDAAEQAAKARMDPRPVGGWTTIAETNRRG